jgi:hypothetical protein
MRCAPSDGFTIMRCAPTDGFTNFIQNLESKILKLINKNMRHKKKYKLEDVGDGWEKVTEIVPLKVERKRINSQTSRPLLKKFKKVSQKQKIYHFGDGEE